MLENFKFDYYYGNESEQFSFYRIPRILIKDKNFKNISSDAKLLYGLMLDRMAMSMKNGWLDENNRVYIIYTLENIMEDLGCGKDKGVKILAELDNIKGIGLIERKKRGLGKPTIIYVKNFIHIENEVLTSEKPNSEDTENRNTDFEKSEVLSSEKSKSKVLKNSTVDFGKSEGNYNNNNYNNMNYNNIINPINPINQIVNDGINYYMDIVKKNIEYDYYINFGNVYDKQLVEELYKIICDIVCGEKEYFIIGGNKYPYDLVKSRFLSIRQPHIEYVLECMKKNTGKIKNIKSYLITALYNSTATINSYYSQEVHRDLYG